MSRARKTIKPANILPYLSSLARVKPLARAEEAESSLTEYARCLKADNSSSLEGSFALAINKFRREPSNFFPGYADFRTAIKSFNNLLAIDENKPISYKGSIPSWAMEMVQLGLISQVHAQAWLADTVLDDGVLYAPSPFICSWLKGSGAHLVEAIRGYTGTRPVVREKLYKTKS